MSRNVRLLRRAPLAQFAALTLMLSPAGAARAQSSQSARDARRNEIEARQRALWDLERLKREPRGKSKGGRPAYRDVENEFERLQLANYSLAGLASQSPKFDYDGVRKQAAEVNRSASRLKAYLALPKPDGDGKQKKAPEPLRPEEMASAVASLDALVNGFVWNPVFSHPDVVDSEKSVKASRDLEEIISLSERIRKCAEGLLKGAGKE